jgi:hypothetical protein
VKRHSPYLVGINRAPALIEGSIKEVMDLVSKKAGKKVSWKETMWLPFF